MMYKQSMKYLLTIAFFLLLTACAHQLAKPIDEKIAVNLTLAQIKTKIPDSVGQRVRWGGVIANVKNAPQSTIIEIVARPLNRQGRPMAVDQTAGRFLAQFDGFIDPVVYAKGRDITVVGAVSNEKTQLIDAFEYKYVAIQVDHHKLWPLIVERPVFYYDPYWNGPGYPFNRWPHYSPWHNKPAKK